MEKEEILQNSTIKKPAKNKVKEHNQEDKGVLRLCLLWLSFTEENSVRQHSMGSILCPCCEHSGLGSPGIQQCGRVLTVHCDFYQLLRIWSWWSTGQNSVFFYTGSVMQMPSFCIMYNR